MTKMKSKKMTKSTFAIIIMGIAMVAMLAFGGTFAYFTATTTAVDKSAKTGRVQLGANTNATIETKVVPGQELLPGTSDEVAVSNNSNVKTIIYVTFSATFTKATGTGYNTATPKEVASPAKEGEYALKPTVESGWKALGDTYANVYYMVVDAQTTEGTAVSISVCKSITFEGVSSSTETLKGSLMDGTLKVSIQSSAIQYEGLTGADDAAKATAGYGLIK